MAELLRYFPSDGDVTDVVEFDALKAAENWPFGADVTLNSMSVPIHKFSSGTVNEALEKYMGITFGFCSREGAAGRNSGDEDERNQCRREGFWFSCD